MIGADLCLDLGTELVGIVAVGGPVGRIDVAVVDVDEERLLGEHRVLDVVQRRGKWGCAATGTAVGSKVPTTIAVAEATDSNVTGRGLAHTRENFISES